MNLEKLARPAFRSRVTHAHAPEAIGLSGPVNFLHDPPGRDALTELFRLHGPRSVLPAWGDTRWQASAENPLLLSIGNDLVRRALAEADAPLPPLTDALYRDYAAAGVRLSFERPYFERRRRLGRAAIALLVQGKAASRALRASFSAKLEEIFSEESWALPVHVHNPTGRDSRTLDLFAAETANLLAECLAVFGELIPRELARRIRARLRTDVFENYLSGDFFWMRATHNWNAVCHQGILGAALALETDATLLANLFVKARLHLPRFLEGFGADGACSEGPSYWDYGFGWFSALNHQLETRTGGELSIFADDPKIRAIAGYGPAMSLKGGKLINFSDCDPKWSLRPSTLQYLGETLGQDDCLRLAWVNYRSLANGAVDYDAERADCFYWLRLFLHAPTSAPEGIADGLKSDAFFPSLGLWAVQGLDRQGRQWELAAKAGHNAEHHNHNDVGGFVLVVDGVPLATEIGMPEYTADYFSARRYEFLAARTLGHSLPVINGHEQAAGAEYSGAVFSAETDDPVVTFEADLTNAYPPSADCRQFIRQLTLDKTAGLCVWRDDIRLERPGLVESAFVTDAPEVLIESPSTALVRKNGLVLELVCEGSGVWTRVETHPYSAHDGSQAICKRLVLAPAKGRPVDNFTCTVRLSIRDR